MIIWTSTNLVTLRARAKIRKSLIKATLPLEGAINSSRRATLTSTFPSRLICIFFFYEVSGNAIFSSFNKTLPFEKQG